MRVCFARGSSNLHCTDIPANLMWAVIRQEKGTWLEPPLIWPLDLQPLHGQPTTGQPTTGQPAGFASLFIYAAYQINFPFNHGKKILKCVLLIHLCSIVVDTQSLGTSVKEVSFICAWVWDGHCVTYILISICMANASAQYGHSNMTFHQKDKQIPGLLY